MIADTVEPPSPPHCAAIEWREVKQGTIRPFYTDENGVEVESIWSPLPGTQTAFIHATPIFEVLYHGTRGNGKTDCLLFDFIKNVGIGYGAEHRGILFRQTYPQLSDVVNKSKKWFPQIFPGAKFNHSSYTWIFPAGERLMFRHIRTRDDYWNYHGHAYNWIAFEELCSWPDDGCYLAMMSCCRSTVHGLPRSYRATANPYGPGHNWVKKRFNLPAGSGTIISKKGEPPRTAIAGNIYENKILLAADPDYIAKIRQSARNEAELRAWLEGSWDIVSGGMFDDVWDAAIHAVRPFPVHLIPDGWRVDRAFDWGSSAPFSVGWFAESNGEPVEYLGRKYGTVRGDVYMIAEWYGSTGTNEGLRMLAVDVGRGIVERERSLGIASRVKPGPADSSIFDRQNGNCIADDMARSGCRWEPADKGAGSRVQGWEQIRKMLSGAVPPRVGIRENPGLFIFNTCENALNLIPVMPRDGKNLDDLDTTAEDHIADMLRYRIRRKVRGVKQSGF